MLFFYKTTSVFLFRITIKKNWNFCFIISIPLKSVMILCLKKIVSGEFQTIFKHFFRSEKCVFYHFYFTFFTPQILKK